MIAKKLGGEYIWIEKDSFYIEIANKRLEKVVPLPEQTLTYPLEVKKPKVPFGNLIESGYIKSGEILYSKDRKHNAQVLANGTLISEDKVGSIHKVSAQILGKTANNGRAFWFVEKNGALKSIDELREEYFKKHITL